MKTKSKFYCANRQNGELFEFQNFMLQNYFSCMLGVLAVLVSGGLSGPPPYPLIIILLSIPLVHTGTALLSKKYDQKLWTRDQRRQKLKFGTKLGMNSPFQRIWKCTAGCYDYLWVETDIPLVISFNIFDLCTNNGLCLNVHIFIL